MHCSYFYLYLIVFKQYSRISKVDHIRQITSVAIIFQVFNFNILPIELTINGCLLFDIIIPYGELERLIVGPSCLSHGHTVYMTIDIGKRLTNNSHFSKTQISFISYAVYFQDKMYLSSQFNKVLFLPVWVQVP